MFIGGGMTPIFGAQTANRAAHVFRSKGSGYGGSNKEDKEPDNDNDDNGINKFIKWVIRLFIIGMVILCVAIWLHG